MSPRPVEDLAKILAAPGQQTAAQRGQPLSGGLAIVRHVNGDGTIVVDYNGALYSQGNGVTANCATDFTPVVGHTVVLLIIGTQVLAICPMS